jgi:hypothetical protein
MYFLIDSPPWRGKGWVKYLDVTNLWMKWKLYRKDTENYSVVLNFN